MSLLNGNGKEMSPEMLARIRRIEQTAWFVIRTLGMAGLIGWATWQSTTMLDLLRIVIKQTTILEQVQAEQASRTGDVRAIPQIRDRLDNQREWLVDHEGRIRHLERPGGPR